MELLGQIIAGLYAVMLVISILAGPLFVDKPRKPLTLGAWASSIVMAALVLAALIYAYWL